MARFLVDEDPPGSLAQSLRESGLAADHVRDREHQGASDEAVLRLAVAEGRALISADLGFANVLSFPLGSHSGIIVASSQMKCRLQS